MGVVFTKLEGATWIVVPFLRWMTLVSPLSYIYTMGGSSIYTANLRTITIHYGNRDQPIGDSV